MLTKAEHAYIRRLGETDFIFAIRLAETIRELDWLVFHRPPPPVQLFKRNKRSDQDLCAAYCPGKNNHREHYAVIVKGLAQRIIEMFSYYPRIVARKIGRAHV